MWYQAGILFVPLFQRRPEKYRCRRFGLGFSPEEPIWCVELLPSYRRQKVDGNPREPGSLCERCQERLLNRYPQLPDILDLNFVSFDAALGNVENLKVLRKEAFEIKVIFVAFDHDSLCLHTALELERSDPDRFSKI